MAKASVLEGLEAAVGMDRLVQLKTVQEYAKLLRVRPKVLLYLGLAGLVFVLSLPGLRVLTFCVMNVLVPAYLSVKSLENNSEYNAEHWFGYWFCFGFWLLFDGVMRLLLSLLPVYWFFRIAILTVIFLNKDYGGGKIFSRFLDPTFQTVLKFGQKHVALFEQVTGLCGPC